MKASDLKLEEVVSFEPGKIGLHGRRLLLQDMRALAQVRRDLLDLAGLEATRRVMTRFGFFCGNADAAAMTRIFDWDSLDEWIRAGVVMHTLQGVTRAVVKSLEHDADAGRFRMEVAWHDSWEAEEPLGEQPPTDEGVCWMLVGYASGYATFCMGTNVYFVERQCLSQGKGVCLAEGRDEAGWGEEIAGYKRYFQEVEHIQERIRELTVKLREKTRLLERQKQRLAMYEERAIEPLVEIRSEAFRRVVEVAARVARFDTSVLITGESGVGKEVIARYIHRLSNRASGPFAAINCGALPETLLESELFGHKQGAFTGAVSDRVGHFEQAGGGTVFLDEIGDVSPAMQLKLLRVLQEREVIRVGESQPRKIDVRVMAATNRDLAEEIRAGRFREDLFYRLGVIELLVPPLRERPEDIAGLARHFVGKLADKLNLPKLRLDARCLDYLQRYSWPGNVRELENAIERAAVLSNGQTILPAYLPPTVLHQREEDEPDSALHSLAEVERRHIDRVLAATQGNRRRAAEILGVSTTTLWRKLRPEDEQ